MSSIFNSFLFLFSSWILLMFISENVSIYYLVCGIISSILISWFSYRIRLVDKNNKSPLYFSFGFYTHFIKVFINNFLGSIKLIFLLALDREPIKPKLYKVSFGKKINFDQSLLIVTINMMVGLLFIDFSKDEISIHVLDKEYFDEKSLKEMILSLGKTNDDNNGY